MRKVLVGVGVVLTVQSIPSPHDVPRVPWLTLAALGFTYFGLVLWVVPALEQGKVVPDTATWVARHAERQERVADYRLNRWSAAFRFYVDRHITLLESPEEARRFFEGPTPFYCLMLASAYERFAADGVPLQVVYSREGLWATSGRALWRRRDPLTQFVVVTGARAEDDNAVLNGRTRLEIEQARQPRWVK